MFLEQYMLGMGVGTRSYMCVRASCFRQAQTRVFARACAFSAHLPPDSFSCLGDGTSRLLLSRVYTRIGDLILICSFFSSLARIQLANLYLQPPIFSAKL